MWNILRNITRMRLTEERKRGQILDKLLKHLRKRANFFASFLLVSTING